MAHKLLRHSLIYTGGNIAARGLNFLIQITVWSNIFTPADYGQIAYCYVFISFMAVILPFGLDAAFMNFYLRRKEKNAYLSNVYLLVFALAAFFVLSFFIFRRTLAPLAIRSDMPQLLTLSLTILFFDIINNLGILYLRAEERAVLSVLLQNAEILIRLILLILLVTSFSAKIVHILWANLISSFLLFAVLNILMLPKLRVSLLSRPRMRELLLFGLPFMLSGIFDRSIELADRRLLGYFLDDAAVGMYVASYTVAVLIRLLVYSFNAGWQPYFLQEIDKPKGLERMEKIYMRTAGLLLLAWVLASLWMPELVRIPLGAGRHILNAAYWPAIPVIPVIMGAYVMMGLYFLELPGIYYRNKTYLNALFMGAAAFLNIGLNLLMIPRYGMMGAALATAAAYALMAVLIRLWNIRHTPLKRGNLKLLIMIGLSAGTYLLLQAEFVNTGTRIAGSLIYVALMYLMQPLKFADQNS
ncbi:MAG: oligosaccharide flippase family protein [Candidatus Neomarinimicrobiota bacterium]|jgi:O-antigen/teichoic acid export membrane protein|nr:oligosaccharide flippase family protein [Candidatus Neomarinimicrobiota bacterium]MDX9779489.1 oligosaccharide flippase family protein [bacterium]